MKSKWIIIFFTFLLVNVLFSETINLANGEWIPFTSASMEGNGFISEIVTEAFKLEGVTVEYTFLPWTRGYEYVKKGTIDGSLAYIKNKEREKEVLFSDSMWNEYYFVAFALKSTKINISKPSDLASYKLILQRGYSYGNIVDGMIKENKLKIDIVDSDIQAFKMIIAGRGEVFLTNNVNGLYILGKDFPDQKNNFEYVNYEPGAEKAGNHLIISKVIPNGPELIKKFNSGLKKLKANGKFDQIVKNYR